MVIDTSRLNTEEEAVSRTVSFSIASFLFKQYNKGVLGHIGHTEYL